MSPSAVHPFGTDVIIRIDAVDNRDNYIIDLLPTGQGSACSQPLITGLPVLIGLWVSLLSEEACLMAPRIPHHTVIDESRCPALQTRMKSLFSPVAASGYLNTRTKPWGWCNIIQVTCKPFLIHVF